jgi:hypothetical protein
MPTPQKRFTVRLSQADYQKLVAIGDRHRPRLTRQYLVNWAIQRLLDRATDPQLDLELGDPLQKEKR